MLKTRLHELLECLSEEDLKKIKSRLASQFKRETKIRRLFAYLYKSYPSSLRKKLPSKEMVFKELFGDSPFNEGNLAEVSFRLTKEVEQFLINKEIEESLSLQDTLLCRALKRKGNDKLFGQKNRKRLEAIKKEQTKGRADYQALFELEYQVSFHRATKKFTTNYKQQLVNTSTQLDYSYLYNKLHIACELISNGLIIANDDLTGLLPVPIDVLNQRRDELPTTIQWYLDILCLYETNDEQLYERLERKLLVDNISISKDEHYNFTIFLYNYCNQKYKTSKETTAKLAGLYKFMITKEMLIEDAYITVVNYYNSINILLGANEISFAKKMLTYSDYLSPDEDKENCKLLTFAMVDFAESNYKIALIKLKQINFKNVLYSLTTKCLTVRTYYEMGDYVLAIKEAKNARRYLNNTKLSENYIIRNKHFFNFVSALSQHKKNSTPSKEVLSEYLDNYESIVYIEWCSQKLAEL